MTDDHYDPDADKLRISFEPQQVAEAMYLLARADILDSLPAEPWVASFATVDRHTQGAILYMWGTLLASNIRVQGEHDWMIQFAQTQPYIQQLQHLREDHGDEPGLIEAAEWAIRMLTASGECDVDNAKALMGSAPADDDEYGSWIGLLLGLWEMVTYACSHYQEVCAEAVGQTPIPSMWKHNLGKMGHN